MSAGTLRLRRVVWVVAALLVYLVVIWVFGVEPAEEQVFFADLSAPALLAGEDVDLGAGVRDGLSIGLILDPPDITEASDVSEPYARLSYLAYTYPTALPEDEVPETLCIDEILIGEVVGGGYALSFFDDARYPLCLARAELQQTFSETGTTLAWWADAAESATVWRAVLTADANHLWYPFDDFELRFYPQVAYRVAFADGTERAATVFPDASFTVEDTIGWQISADIAALDRPFQHPRLADALDIAFDVHLRRPTVEQIIPPSLILLMFCIIALLTLLDSTGSFVEGAVGVLFGIFAVREIAVPPGVEGRNLFDYAIWGLYFAFAGAVAHRVAYLASRRSKTPTRPGDT